MTSHGASFLSQNGEARHTSFQSFLATADRTPYLLKNLLRMDRYQTRVLVAEKYRAACTLHRGRSTGAPGATPPAGQVARVSVVLQLAGMGSDQDHEEMCLLRYLSKELVKAKNRSDNRPFLDKKTREASSVVLKGQRRVERKPRD